MDIGLNNSNTNWWNLYKCSELMINLLLELKELPNLIKNINIDVVKDMSNLVNVLKIILNPNYSNKNIIATKNNKRVKKELSHFIFLVNPEISLFIRELATPLP